MTMTTVGLHRLGRRHAPDPVPRGNDEPARGTAAAEWSCDNCATPNVARRRCRDCGTLRY